MSKPQEVPRTIWLIAGLIVIAQLASILFWAAGKLYGPQRNLVPQAILGGGIILLALVGYVLRYWPGQFRLAPSRVGLALLVVAALALCGVYFFYVRPIISLHYDLASWSEGYFVNDVNKWHAGARLYVTPQDSNSSVYTPAAPMLTYFVASALRHPTSIHFYRLILQCYLLLSALFAAGAAWHLVCLAMPERSPTLSRWWIVFFALASFLLATNRITNAFNVFLHVDALGILVTTVAFWLMTKHAVSQDSRWLWAMTIMPSVGFLVKQYLAVWAAVYLIYILLDGDSSPRRALQFAAASFGMLGITVLACLAVWGSSFRYWVLFVMGQQVVSLPQIFDRFVDSSFCTLMGLLAGVVLLRGRNLDRLLGMWLGWVAMVMAASYTAGIAFVPTHLGPATMVGGCFALAALVDVWPDPASRGDSYAEQWLRVGLCTSLAVVVLAGVGYGIKVHPSTTTDFSRYVHDIEHEFVGESPDRVLTDFGDWIYLRDGVSAKDRAAILPVHRNVALIGMLDRVRRRDYDRILVHNFHRPDFAYDRGDRTGIRKALLENYREVRVIPGAKGMEDWLYYQMMLSDVSVLEPKGPGFPARPTTDRASAHAAVKPTLTSSR
jgi:hypothetical protein